MACLGAAFICPKMAKSNINSMSILFVLTHHDQSRIAIQCIHVCDHLSPYRIEVDVANKLEKIDIGFNQNRFFAILKHITTEAMSAIVTASKIP